MNSRTSAIARLALDPGQSVLPPEAVEGDAPPYSRSVLQAVEGAVLPQTIWLVGREQRMGIIAADRSVYGVRFDERSARSRAKEKTILSEPGEGPRAASRMKRRIFRFLSNESELTQEFEEFEEDLADDAGFAPGLIFGHSATAPAAVVEAVEASAAPEEAVAEEGKPEEAPEAKPAVAEAPAAEMVATEAPEAEPVAASATPAAAIGAEVAAEAPAPQSAADEADPQLALLHHLQGKFGPRLVAVWIPDDMDKQARGLIVDGAEVTDDDFAPLSIGLFLRRNL